MQRIVNYDKRLAKYIDVLSLRKKCKPRQNKGQNTHFLAETPARAEHEVMEIKAARPKVSVSVEKRSTEF